MKKRLKSLMLALLTVIVCVTAVSPGRVLAAPTGTANVSAGVSSVIAGENITVSVSINTTTEMYVAEFQMEYDNNLFEFVSTTGPAKTGSPAGVIPFQYDPDFTKTLNFDVVFKAKAVGTGKFSITKPTFVGWEGEEPVEIAMTYSDASVQVMAVGSDDATLSSLQVAGAGLSPEFAKWTMNYTCYVDNSVTAVNIAAVASQGGKVEVGGNFSNLAVGGNNITVTSYAPNGKTMTYTINVVRLEPPTEPPATEPPTTTEPETTLAPIEGSVTVGGVKYTIDSGYSSDIIPAGFDASVVSYEGEDVLAAVSTGYNATLFYLVNESGEGRFFLYDSKAKSFFPYTVIDSGLHRYILADRTLADTEPSGCTIGQITVGELTFDALVSDDNNEFAYFYAINDKGVRGWYCYDRQEKTVQRMYTVDMGNVPEESTPEQTTEPKETQSQTDDGRLGSLENANNALKKDYFELQKMRNLIIAIASVLLVVMLIIIVVMAAHKSEKKRSIDIDVDDLADEEDAIDRADVELAAVGEAAADAEAPEVEAEAETSDAVEADAESDAADAAEADADNSVAVEETVTVEEITDEEAVLPSGHEKALEEILLAAAQEAEATKEMAAQEAEAAEEAVGEPLEEKPAKSPEIEADIDIKTVWPVDVEITQADIDAFEKEAEDIAKSLASNVSDVMDEENREIETEIIDLTDDGAKSVTAHKDKGKAKDDGIEIIDADDDGEDDFFL